MTDALYLVILKGDCENFFVNFLNFVNSALQKQYENFYPVVVATCQALTSIFSKIVGFQRH